MVIAAHSVQESRPRAAIAIWTPALRVVAIVLLLGALFRIPVETYRLMFEPLGQSAASDLVKRHNEVAAWFEGRPFYGAIKSANYPPASYPVFWPFIGWGMQPETARIIWAATSLAALGWLTWGVVRASGAAAPVHRGFLAAAVLAAYAASASIRVGQTGIHLMALLVAAALILARDRLGKRESILAALLMLVTLVKPTFSTPLVWLLVVRGGIAATITIVFGYFALTLIAVAFQNPSVFELIRGWLNQKELITVSDAHANVHAWLGQVGWDDWILPASLTVLALVGVWTFIHRRSDVWLLFGVLAIVSRMWSHHHWYDDVLLIAPLIPLYRIANDEPEHSYEGQAAAALMMAMAVLGAAPASWQAYPPPWGNLIRGSNTLTWTVVLVFLAWRARRSRASGPEHRLQLQPELVS
jgi:hypothetical protein